MTFIKKQLSWWRIVLIVGVAAIAIPIAARVSATGIAVVNQLAQPTVNDNEEADAKHSKDRKAAAGPGVARLQDDYYDRRREYWERRVERRLDRHEEYMDEHPGDDKDDEDAKDSKADKDDDEDEMDRHEDEIERRRDYWRKRLDDEW